MTATTINRVIAGAVGLAAVGAVVVGCSNDKPVASNTTASAKVSTGGNTAVKVDGADLAGLDLNSVTCVKQGGQITVASGAVGGQQGLGVVMSDEATPKVQSLGLVYDGSALSVSDNMGVKVGSAEVKVDGSTYTISGEASGADLNNPMAGMITKPFTITVSCS